MGCINLSELDEFVQAAGLDEEEAAELQEQLDGRGVEVSDDCGRMGIEPTKYANDGLAGTTTDALQLFLNEIRR